MISTLVAPLLREFIIETCGIEGKALRYNYQLLDCAVLTYLLSLDGVARGRLHALRGGRLAEALQECKTLQTAIHHSASTLRNQHCCEQMTESLLELHG